MGEAPRRKLRGKDAGDALDKHGYAALQQPLGDIFADVDKPCFDSVLSGGSSGKYFNEVHRLKRKATTLPRCIYSESGRQGQEVEGHP